MRIVCISLLVMTCRNMAHILCIAGFVSELECSMALDGAKAVEHNVVVITLGLLCMVGLLEGLLGHEESIFHLSHCRNGKRTV